MPVLTVDPNVTKKTVVVYIIIVTRFHENHASLFTVHGVKVVV